VSRAGKSWAVAAVFALVCCRCSLLVDTDGLSGGSDAAAPRSSEGGARDAAATDDGGNEAASPTCTPSPSFDTDAKNCGHCGHDCLGGTCASSQCTETVIVSGQDSLSGIAIDGNDLFFVTGGGQVRHAALDGTNITDVAKAPAADNMAVDATFVYVATSDDRHIYRARRDGTGSADPIAPCTGACLGVTVHEGQVYFTDRGEGSLRRVETNNTATTLASGLDAPEGVFPGPSRFLVSNEAAGNILALPYGASSFTHVLDVADPVSAMEDGTDFWVVSQSPKQILRIPLAGGSPTIVAQVTSQPVGMAQTDEAIYWVTGDGKVHRLAK
jgi:hypothetical protein